MISLPVLLPNGFIPLVTNGETVTAGQPLAQKVTKHEQVVNIVKQLAIPLAKVKKVLKKNPGDMVEVGDIIAVNKGFLGLSHHSIKSRVEGKVTRYERDTGNLIIQTAAATRSENLVSPVDGTISLCDNEKIVINTDKNVALGTIGSGGRSEGHVYIIDASFKPEISDILYHLDSRALGKIVVGKNLSRDVIVKGIGIGALGVIGSGIKADDFEHIANKYQTTPILEVETETIEKLVAWNGKKIFVDGDAKSIVFLQI